MLRRDHPERHVLIDGLRIQWRIHRCWRTIRSHVDLHPRSFDELADLLGHCAWKKVLLHCTGPRLGYSRRALHSHHVTYRSQLPFRQRLSRQPCRLHGRLLGSLDGHRWHSWYPPAHHICLLLARLPQEPLGRQPSKLYRRFRERTPQLQR